MQAIPTPQLLDPDRIIDNDRGDFTVDHRARAEVLKQAFLETTEYAQQLWNALAVAREYLYSSLPSDPRDPGDHPRTSTAPTGPDDEAGWQAWTEVAAGVTSILCGPHGDSGFGRDEAHEAARFRRD